MGDCSRSIPTSVRSSPLLKYLVHIKFSLNFDIKKFFFFSLSLRLNLGRGKGKGGEGQGRRSGWKKEGGKLRRSTAMSTLVVLPQRSCHILYA